MTITTRKVIVISTEHLCSTTIDRLHATPLEKWPVSGGPIAFGFYMHAREYPDAQIDGFPGLFAALAWARRKGFDYVQFDGDEEPNDDLEVFDHEAIREYGFDVVLLATIRVKASSEHQARQMLAEKLDTADCNAGAWDDGQPITFEASVAGERLPNDPVRLYAIDGEEI